jgi:hypothetical protein
VPEKSTVQNYFEDFRVLKDAFAWLDGGSYNWSNSIFYLLGLPVSDSSPLPLTPDYAGSEVRYADGVFDPHFHRYITIMEGD